MAWKDPFMARSKSRRLRAPRIYRLHANGTNISCYTIAVIRHEYEPNREDPDDDIVAVYAPSADHALPSRAENVDYNALDLFEPSGYALLLKCIQRTRWKAGAAWKTAELELQSAIQLCCSTTATPIHLGLLMGPSAVGDFGGVREFTNLTRSDASVRIHFYILREGKNSVDFDRPARIVSIAHSLSTLLLCSSASLTRPTFSILR